MKLTKHILCVSLLAAAFSSAWAFYSGPATLPRLPTNEAIAAPSAPTAAVNRQAQPQQKTEIAKQNTVSKNTAVAQNDANGSQLSANDTNAEKS